jgi:hypothetical protein
MHAGTGEPGATTRAEPDNIDLCSLLTYDGCADLNDKPIPEEQCSRPLVTAEATTWTRPVRNISGENEPEYELVT